jgi:hypothetical protein
MLERITPTIGSRMSTPLEDWSWTVRFSTRDVDIHALTPRQMWAAVWARMSRSHRYISLPQISRTLSEEGHQLTVEVHWRSMHEPEYLDEEPLDQTPGCYLAWYKNVDERLPTRAGFYARDCGPPLSPIDAPW